MNLNKKLPAFTLSEMMVVLVLSAIVISIAMVVLNLVQKQIAGVNRQFTVNKEIQQLELALWRDMNLGNVWYDDKRGEILIYSFKDTVRYHFTHNYALRNDDTLNVEVLDYQIFSDGYKIKGNKVDAISLRINKSGQQRNLFVFKPNAADYYMN